MQHRQEDSHAVYVIDNRYESSCKHRQEDRHAVYVVENRDESNSKCCCYLKQPNTR